MKIAEEMLTLNDGRTLVLRSAEEKDGISRMRKNSKGIQTEGRNIH